MSSYVESVLGEGETIIHRATISHWNFLFLYVVGTLFVLGGIGLLVVSMNRQDISQVMAAIPLVIGLLLILIAIINRSTTELALTNRRIIVKRGLVSRNTIEMNLGKIESIHVNQGLLGRMLNYGDVTVVGTGSSLEPLHGIAEPLMLRRKLGEVTSVRTNV